MTTPFLCVLTSPEPLLRVFVPTQRFSAHLAYSFAPIQPRVNRLFFFATTSLGIYFFFLYSGIYPWNKDVFKASFDEWVLSALHVSLSSILPSLSTGLRFLIRSWLLAGPSLCSILMNLILSSCMRDTFNPPNRSLVTVNSPTCPPRSSLCQSLPATASPFYTYGPLHHSPFHSGVRPIRIRPSWTF